MVRPLARPINKPVLIGVAALAAYAPLVCALWGAWTPVTAVDLAFYLLLLLNTYFSLTFTDATYRLRFTSDTALNILLVGLFVGLPWLMWLPVWFFLAMGAFFGVAVIKYASWLTRIEAGFFLRRKLIANTLGALECLAMVAILSLVADPLWPVLVGAVVYGYANLHTLVIDPLYREH